MALTKKPSFIEKLVPILMLASIGLAFAIGILWQKVNELEGEKATTVATANTTPAPQVAQPQTAKVDINQIKDLFKKNLITFGDATRKVLFVEVADPSCPYCHVAGGLNPDLNNQMGPTFKLVAEGGTYVAPVPEMKKLVDSGKASFVYIYSPGHGNGEMGTKALYCAHEKGKFWQVHDLLMTSKGYDLLNTTVKNDPSKSADLVAYLKSAVDPAFLKSCIDSGKYNQRLKDDTALAATFVTFGIQGTPGFFVNETSFAGAYSYKDMESLVDNLLKS